MKILQFTCIQDPPVTALKILILKQINTWSRLRWLTSDVEYVTEMFDMSIWHAHTTTQGIWWLNYNSVYAQLGDDGKIIADQLLGDGPLQGILKNSPLVNAFPDTKIQVLEVDVYADGYLPQPEEI